MLTVFWARFASFIVLLASLSGAQAQGLFGGGADASVVQTDLVKAELVALAPDGVSPGKTFWVGLRLTHQPHWHTYWKNPGDSGLATQLNWTLPPGLNAGAIAWPAPRKIPIGNLANYGFEGTVLLPVPVNVDKNFSTQASSVPLKLAASWLVCRQECVPQEGNFTLMLPVRSSTAMVPGDFEASRRAAPADLAGRSKVGIKDNSLVLSVEGLPTAWQGKSLNVFPETTEIIETALSPSATDSVVPDSAHPGHQTWSKRAGAGSGGATVWQAAMPLSNLRSSEPKEIAFVVSRDGLAVRTVAIVQGTWPPASAQGSPATTVISPALQAALDKNRAAAQGDGPLAPATPGSWWLALGAALLGGLILNLMPCVFPVLAIKVLAFARPASGARAGHRLEGLAYTAGVVVSFTALGGLMLALRAGGEQLGWGFQLQSPAFVAALAVLFSLIGLNLMGLLELRTLLPSGLASLQLRHPLADAALSGVLAVAVASPCTAPFMGASLGFAITLPAAQALAIFAVLGLGLALPFLLASWVPAVARALPRPGVWMDTLRRFLAFPMWATVIWLLWVHGHLSGVDGAAGLLALIWALAFVLWALGQPGRAGKVVSGVALAALVLLGVWLGPSVVASAPEAAATETLASSGASTQGDAATQAAPAVGQWQNWAPGRAENETAAGRPVFVDFTAAWCITCQYNKKTTLSDASVLADFAQRKVVLLRADWTRRDPAITQALATLGRSGVPVYVLYAPGRAPVVMSEILRADDLKAELAKI